MPLPQLEGRSMKQLSAVPVGLAVAVALGAQAPRRALSVDDLMALSSIVDVKISPDGARVAFVVSTPSIEKNEHVPALFVVPASGGPAARVGESLRIFNTPSPLPRLSWSPDSTSVSVLAFADSRPQVFAVPGRGGEPRQLTSAQEGVLGYEWSPDGRSLAYLTRDPMPPDEARQRQDRSFVIEADTPDRPARLVVQPLAAPEPARGVRVLTPPTHYVDSFAWAPDGDEIAYAAAPRSGFMAPYATRLYAIPAAGGLPRTVVDRDGINVMPRYSPDGRWIALVSTNGRAEIMAPRSLTVVPSRGGTPRAINMDDAWVNEFVWTPDSRSILLQANDGTFARRDHMFEQPIVRVSVADGRAERVAGGPLVASWLSLSADGRRLAYKGVGARTMGEVEMLELTTGHATTLSDVNPTLRGAAVGDLKPISWHSFDGMEIWGLLLTPPGAPPGRRLPLLVYIHGGPGGGFTYGLFPQFMHTSPQVDPYPTAALAGAGYAALFPMPRGGAGYGEAGQRMIVNAWGEGDFKDIMAGVDRLVGDGIADPDRLGVMGASYGGYMTNWIVTQTTRFKAASSGASISDLADLYYQSEGGDFMVEYFKRPWENRASYEAHSPITFADRVTTPLLLQHGEIDPRVPIAGAWKFYRALKAMDKTVELEVYPRGGHVLREPAQQREQMRRNLEWFMRWIPPG
jgi:dipeptidyl aminopeptidase/acylaminoacyl peptidase